MICTSASFAVLETHNAASIEKISQLIGAGERYCMSKRNGPGSLGSASGRGLTGGTGEYAVFCSTSNSVAAAGVDIGQVGVQVGKNINGVASNRCGS